ncbi:MAG: ubiquitin-like domain-containing protein [Candidatus Aquilonibacter sp.]
MIGRGPLRRSHVLCVSVLTAGLVWAGFATYPSPVYAGNTAALASVSHVVLFTTGNDTTTQATAATTVGEFLRERGIVANDGDYVSPSTDTPLSDRMSIEYRAAVSVTLVADKHRATMMTAAPNIAAFLQSENIALGKYDEVSPSLKSDIPANGVVRVTRVLRWQRLENRAMRMPVVHLLNVAMSPGASKVASQGRAGMRQVLVAFTQHDAGSITATVVASRIVTKPKPRVIEAGALGSMQMIATAYTPYCSGCSGITATGRPAGHGIVAVDPRVIPLGSRLYIPGYGYAIAGDTGGAIVGYRIDLGYTSNHDAMQFGRRAVMVYRLK